MERNFPARPVPVIAFGATLLAVLIVLLAGADHGSAEAIAARGGNPPIGNGNGGAELTEVGSDFQEPVYTATAPGKANRNLLFVVERGGKVKVIRKGNTVNKAFLKITDQLDLDFNERGLLSIVFDPGYAKNRRFYVYYTSSPDGDVTVAQYRTEKDNKLVADPDSGQVVISIPHGPFPNHNGGEVTFGPDGNMYLATGDGGFACDPNENAQNLDSLLGKLLRITPSKNGGYTVPKDNPFVKRAGADEVYAYGLRNPFRFSFDKATKTLAIGDVGQDLWEEVDYAKVSKTSGANFGWDVYEGFVPLELSDLCITGMFNGVPFTDGDQPNPPVPGTTYTDPIAAYPHASEDPDVYTGCAIIGGPVVRDERLKSLYGRYLYSDSCNGGLQSLVPHTSGATGNKPTGLSLDLPASIAEGRKHQIYLTSLSGSVYRLDPSSGPTPTSSDASTSLGGAPTGNGGDTFQG